MGVDRATGDAPPVEMIDVVDADNRVVDTLPRAEVHRRGLRHRAVHMLVEDRAGRIYLQRRAESKDVDPGLWDTSAAGHVDAGEDYEAAARRELEEELGLTDVTLETLCELPARLETGLEFVRVYRGVTGAEPRPDPREIIEGGWWSPADIEHWLAREPARFTGTFKLIFAALRGSEVEA